MPGRRPTRSCAPCLVLRHHPLPQAAAPDRDLPLAAPERRRGRHDQRGRRAGRRPALDAGPLRADLRLRRLLRLPGHLQGARQGLLARRPRAPAASGGGTFLNGLVAASQASLARLGDDFDIASFERMVAVLAEADLIHVIGSKRAFPVTAYVSLALSQQGVRNVLVDNVGSGALDQVGCVCARRRGARRQLQPLQFDHARPRRGGARARRPHRRDHRQHLQPAGAAVRRAASRSSNPISPASARSPPSLAVGMAAGPGRRRRDRAAASTGERSLRSDDPAK